MAQYRMKQKSIDQKIEELQNLKKKERETKREAKEILKEEEREAKREAREARKEAKEAERELAKQQKEANRLQNIKNIEDEADLEYMKIKKEVEKKYFILNDQGKFGFFDNIQNKFLIKSREQVKLNLAPYKLKEITSFGVQKKSFFERWIEDPERRNYDAIVFDPKFKNKNDFNLFTGFKYETMKNPEKDTSIIHQLLDHLFITETENYKDHILDWLSFIIQKKDKTNICISMYSAEHGVGKNSFIELIRKLIDEKYVSKLENIDELNMQFNSWSENKFILYGDEILAKTKDLYLQLKNSITRSQIKINKKNVDAYEQNNYANYIFSTNERVPFGRIEKNDRRLDMLHVSEKKLDNNLARKFYNTLEDDEIICSFFHELLIRRIPDELNCLDTPLKREIQNAYTLSPIKFLYKNYTKLEGQIYSVNQLFEMIKEFERKNNFTDVKTSQHMSQILSTIYDFTFRTAEKRGYKFKNLDTILKNYDKKMFQDYEEHDDYLNLE